MRKYLVLAILALVAIIYVKTNINLMNYIEEQVLEFLNFDKLFDEINQTISHQPRR